MRGVYANEREEKFDARYRSRRQGTAEGAGVRPAEVPAHDFPEWGKGAEAGPLLQEGVVPAGLPQRADVLQPLADQESAAELPAVEAAEAAPVEEAPASQEEVTGVGTPSAPENVTVLPMTSHTELDAEAENGENADHAADAQSGYTDDMTVEEICERMTMDEARDILVPLGTCKGWTLGQVLDRRPTSLRWYMVGCQDASNILKAGATLLWNYRQTQKAG